MSIQTIPVHEVYGNPVDEIVQPETNNPMFEIKKILYRLRWCEDSIKSGRNGNDENLQYLTNRVRDLEGFLAVMDGERVREVSRKYFKKRDRERFMRLHPTTKKAIMATKKAKAKNAKKDTGKPMKSSAAKTKVMRPKRTSEAANSVTFA